jgi:hypothetical protein
MSHWYLVPLVCAALALQCGHGNSLSQEEMAKLDPGLRQLYSPTPPGDASYDVSVRANGVKEYGVIIRSTSPQDLRDAGINPGSIFGDVITARVSLEELRRVVALPTVRAVEQGNRNEIH